VWQGLVEGVISQQAEGKTKTETEVTETSFWGLDRGGKTRKAQLCFVFFGHLV
jgi:hypothetical protein